MSQGGDGRRIAKRRKGRPPPPEKPSYPVTLLLSLLDLTFLDDRYGNHGRGRRGHGPGKLAKCLLLVRLKYGSEREVTRALAHYPSLREAIGLDGVPDRTCYSHFRDRLGPRGFTVMFLVLADAAYDAIDIREAVIRVLGATLFIAMNIRKTPGRNEVEKRRNRAKLLRRWHKEEGLLGKYIDPRGVRFKGFFKQRTSVERNNGNGKENFGLNSLKFRGLERATVHVALCLSAELAVALAAHRVGRPDLKPPRTQPVSHRNARVRGGSAARPASGRRVAAEGAMSTGGCPRNRVRRWGWGVGGSKFFRWEGVWNRDGAVKSGRNGIVHQPLLTNRGRWRMPYYDFYKIMREHIFVFKKPETNEDLPELSCKWW